MIEPQNPENMDNRPEEEKGTEKPVEKSAELKEEHSLTGAELLENPPDGSFIQGLQAFVTWVQSLVARDD